MSYQRDTRAEFARRRRKRGKKSRSSFKNHLKKGLVRGTTIGALSGGTLALAAPLVKRKAGTNISAGKALEEGVIKSPFSTNAGGLIGAQAGLLAGAGIYGGRRLMNRRKKSKRRFR